MDKMKFETPDMVAGNIEKIGALFPAAITEMQGEDGHIRKGINFKVLKQLLSRDVVDGEECYEFTWTGKNAAMAEVAQPTTKTLRPVKEESRNWDTTQNLYIEGDNLEVLKILQESYLGKVKMIYIDPPYNTGHDFIYRDKFQRSQQEENEQMGMYDEDENQMFENTESNGRFHSAWCSMIYSRLSLARNLLIDDGVIFISIDDSEVGNLRKVADEVFGVKNLVGTILWKKKTNGNNMGFLPPVHDYILCYAKEYSAITDMGYPVSEEFISKTFSNPDNDPRGAWTTSDLSANHKGPYFPITNPDTGEIFYPPQGRYWVFNEQEVLKRIADGRIIFGKSGTARPVQKVFAADRTFSKIRAESWWDKNGMNEDATLELRELFNVSKLFTHPKPSKLIKHLLTISTERNSVVLDFFSGSATTAHAVMQLNAEDGGHRKFIMVQWPEACDEKSEAFKAGYKNICEIGKERIRRAGDKIKEDNPLGTQDLDIGFRVFRVDSSNMKDVYYQPEDLEQQSIFNLVSNIKDDRTDLDLLYACLLDWGVEIHLPHTSTDLDGCTIHNVDNGALMACFSPNVPRSVVEYMAKQQPLRAVFRDSAFASDDAKINVTEIFKNLSPDTKVKVI